MIEWSPSPLSKFKYIARMAIFLQCQISSLSASLRHFPTSGLTGSRILRQNGYLLRWFYIGMIIFSPIKFNSMTETSSLSAVKVQGSLSLTHSTPLRRSTSNWLAQELYAGMINFRCQIWLLYAEMVIFSHIQIWFHTGMVINLYSKNSNLSHILHLSDIPHLVDSVKYSIPNIPHTGMSTENFSHTNLV
jgi:hypothetical protein